MTEEQSYPSLPDQAKNLAKFSFQVVQSALGNTPILVSSEVKEKRLEICRSCEYYDEKQIRCRQCGCFLEHKAQFALDSCPLDKWKTSDSKMTTEDYSNLIQKYLENDPTVSETLNLNPTIQFPENPNVGDSYIYKTDSSIEAWQWDGKIWNPVDPDDV